MPARALARRDRPFSVTRRRPLYEKRLCRSRTSPLATAFNHLADAGKRTERLRGRPVTRPKQAQGMSDALNNEEAD